MSTISDLEPHFDAAAEETSGGIASLSLHMAWKILQELDQTDEDGNPPSVRSRREIHAAARGWIGTAIKASAASDTARINRLVQAMEELQAGDDSLDDVR